MRSPKKVSKHSINQTCRRSRSPSVSDTIRHTLHPSRFKLFPLLLCVIAQACFTHRSEPVRYDVAENGEAVFAADSPTAYPCPSQARPAGEVKSDTPALVLDLSYYAYTSFIDRRSEAPSGPLLEHRR
jgi:hypothetical protein